MHKLKLFTAIALVVLLLPVVGLVVWAEPGFSTPPSPFIPLQKLVSLDDISVQCEGELKTVQGNWSVDCDEAGMRLTIASSLVGQPRRGYAATADLVAPERTLFYSLWLYDDSSEATLALAQWRKHFHGLATGARSVTKRPDGFEVLGEDEMGLPLWGYVARMDNRLAVLEVKALPPPLTEEEVKQWASKSIPEWNLQPENKQATEGFFEQASRTIDLHFLETRKK
ncbi:hypothetical protein D6817_03860 [Candidatus Pacearchaeota archaeon]|nr:MAG: hypothetical protein D6817_03860 [Candidatus Pacearchaeota archaeon]